MGINQVMSKINLQNFNNFDKINNNENSIIRISRHIRIETIEIIIEYL